ncbi:MAG TPA: phosphoribosylformylglycinamidine cyclo-ligase [bacterium]
MTQNRWTYRKAGVDIAAGNEAVRLLAPYAAATRRPGVLGGIGGFGGLFALPRRLKRPVLVASTDGVGTKLKIAFALDRHDTVGIDLVAMSVNDVLVQGAEPLFFLDYVACGRLRPGRIAEIVKGVAEGCRQAGCALLGGETAEMPGFYAPGEYDLAGFAVGAAERGRLIDGSRIRPGDVLLGLPSSGLHSNGYSLARAVVEDRCGPRWWRRALPGDGRSLGEALLAPTRIYVRPVLGLFAKFPVHGLVHLTGGGWTENIPRVLPRGCAAAVDLGSWPVPPLFSFLEREGRIGREEMLRTFNLGVGMILVVRPGAAEDVARALRRRGEACHRVGEVVRGARRVLYRGRWPGEGAGGRP